MDLIDSVLSKLLLTSLNYNAMSIMYISDNSSKEIPIPEQQMGKVTQNCKVSSQEF